MARQVHLMVVGSANTDMVVSAARIPAPGETILGGEFVMVPGGKGANQAVTAARLGARVTFVGCVGADLFGNATRDNLRKEGLATAWVVEDPKAASGVALIAVDSSGQNAIVVAPGANMALRPEHVDRAMDASGDLDGLVLQCEIPLDTVDHAVRRAHAASIPVVLNPAPACTLPQGLLSCVSCVTPNESEASVLTGLDTSTSDGAVEAARALLSMGAASAVVTLGKDGAVVATHSGVERIAPYAVEAVDATAAGDCFTAALACAWLNPSDAGVRGAGVEHERLVRAARYASAAAAVSVTRLGAQPSLPTFNEVAAFIEQAR